MTEPLSLEDIQARIAARQNDGLRADYRYYRPLAEAADEYEQWARSPAERIYLGIKVFDDAMRGLAPRELLLLQGHTHAGKTVVVSQMMMNNANRRIAMFTPDETRVLVLVKLTALVHGVGARELEDRLAADDESARQLLHDTATRAFPNLAVFEESMNLHDMDRALDECEHQWGDKAEVVIFDYLELLDGNEEVKAKLTALKGWGKRRNVPLIVLHQTSRSSGADGKQLTISSGAYGGEQQSTFIIGVRRKKFELEARIRELQQKIRAAANPSDSLYDQLQEAEFDLTVHQNTITVNLVKSKRPPCDLVGDTDFVLDKETGRVRPFLGSTRVTSAAEALAARQTSWDEEF